jgi:hypothetical protein
MRGGDSEWSIFGVGGFADELWSYCGCECGIVVVVVVLTFLPRPVQAKNEDPQPDRAMVYLRFATPSMQAINRRKRGELAKGVRRMRGNLKKPFQARVTVNGKPKHLGYFPTEEEAHAAWVLARSQQFVGDVVNVTINVTINK